MKQLDRGHCKMTDIEALAGYVHELHQRLGNLLIRNLPDASDAWYRPYGALKEYLELVDEMGQRFGICQPEDRFYPPDESTGR